MENRILVEAAYHAKIKAEVLRAESRIGMQIFPITQSYFDACSYGDLKRDFPVQYKIFFSLISKLQSNSRVSKEEIELMTNILPEINNKNDKSQQHAYNTNNNKYFGLLPGERYKGERQIVQNSNIVVVGKDSLEMSLGKQMFAINDVYKIIETQLEKIIPGLVTHLKSQRNSQHISSRSKEFVEILLKAAYGFNLIEEIKKGEKIAGRLNGHSLIYIINYGEVSKKPIYSLAGEGKETKHDNVKRYANPLDVLNFIKQNKNLFDSLN